MEFIGQRTDDLVPGRFCDAVTSSVDIPALSTSMLDKRNALLKSRSILSTEYSRQDGRIKTDVGLPNKRDIAISRGL